MPDPTYNAAHGAIIESSSMASTPVFTEIQGIVDGPDGGGYASESLEAYPHSETTVVSKISKIRPTPITFGLLYDSGNAQHALLRDDAKAGTVRDYKLKPADEGAEVIAFEGQVTQFDRSNQSEDWVKISVTLTPTAAYTET